MLFALPEIVEKSAESFKARILKIRSLNKHITLSTTKI